MRDEARVLTPLIDALEITPIPCDGQLAGRGVEAPSPETTHQGYMLSISGWVHALPAAPARVLVSCVGL